MGRFVAGIHLLILLIFVELLIEPSECYHALENNNFQRCNRWSSAFSQNQASVTASLPPQLKGKWVSESCEVRPGPSFVLRRYLFHGNNSFHFQQFYYVDESCTLPAYALTASGVYRLSQPSWVVPGGMEADYTLQRVTLTPYTKGMAETLSRKVNQTCPRFVRRPWRPLKRYKVHSYVERNHRNSIDVQEDLDCLAPLDFGLNELQLIRLEHRKPFYQKHRPHAMRVELMLGDIHTDAQQRSLYRPTSYQPPLLLAETPSCHVCHIVGKSNDLSPPQLPARAKLPVYLSGEWISTRCEVRPFGLFLTRRLRFRGSNYTWEGTYQYFRDPNCQNRMFQIVARGSYAPGGSSSALLGATNYDFQVQRAFVTPQDELFVSNLNGYDSDLCGPKKSWSANVSQEVTYTGGCVGIGLFVPSTEYDVVRSDVDHHGNTLLYMGQVDTDNRPSSVERRPTSYQIPLIQCSFMSDDYSDNNMLYPLAQVQYRAVVSTNNGPHHNKRSGFFVALVLLTFWRIDLN